MATISPKHIQQQQQQQQAAIPNPKRQGTATSPTAAGFNTSGAPTGSGSGIASQMRTGSNAMSGASRNVSGDGDQQLFEANSADFNSFEQISKNNNTKNGKQQPDPNAVQLVNKGKKPSETSHQVGRINPPHPSNIKGNDDQFRITYASIGDAVGPPYNKAAGVGAGSPRYKNEDRQGQAPSTANTVANSGNKAAQQLADDAKNRTIGHYVVGKSLGSGTFGKVRIGTHTITGEKVAIKILEKDRIKDKGDVERVTREINILKKVRHPNVIQLYEIIETSRQLFLIMEYASGGELFDFIVKRKKLKETEACKFFQQVISGVEYIHHCGICHRDLKPENLLLDENKNIKIVDFGLSNTYTEGGLLKTACGSPCYAAPEMIAGKKYHGQASDIWSCGIILYAMTCGYLPFEDPNTNILYKKILACDYKIPSNLSPTLKDLMKKILNTKPEKRITISDIRTHEWYTKIRSVEMEGVIVGKDRIPIIQEFIEVLKNHFNGENLEQSTTFVQNNKHNQVTSTYYLLLKKKERMTGKNYVFEQVTFDKNKNLYSTSNLNGHFTKGFDSISMNSTQKLFGQTYAKSEGKNFIENRDSKSNGGTSSVTRDSSITRRVTDIINLPSKAFTPSNRPTVINKQINNNIAMQTFNADSIKAHNDKQSHSQAPTGHNNFQKTAIPVHKRVVSENPGVQGGQTASDNHGPRRLVNEPVAKNAKGFTGGVMLPQGGIKSQLAHLNNTGQLPTVHNHVQDVFRNKLRTGAVQNMGHENTRVFQQRPGSLDQKATMGVDIISEANAQITSVSAGGPGLGGLSPQQQSLVQQIIQNKPDTSHTVQGHTNNSNPNSNTLLAHINKNAAGNHNIMAQTFTGKFYNNGANRNQQAKSNLSQSNQNQSTSATNSKPGGISNNSSNLRGGPNHNNSGNLQNNIMASLNSTQTGNSPSQQPNMSMLLTQFFPNNTNNNYTAKHQQIIGQESMRANHGNQKNKKKMRNFESHSPQRTQGHALVKLQQNSNGFTDEAQQYHSKLRMQGMNATTHGFNPKISQSHDHGDDMNGQARNVVSSFYQKNSNSVGQAQQRRLIDTSNMFAVYRNSLKNSENAGLSMSSPGTADTHAHPSTGPTSNKNSHMNIVQQNGKNPSHFNMMYSTARNVMHQTGGHGFYQQEGQQQFKHQNQGSHNSKVMIQTRKTEPASQQRNNDLGTILGSAVHSQNTMGHENSGQNHGRFLPASQAHMLNQSLKVQDLIRMGNNKSGGSNTGYNLEHPKLANQNQDYISRQQQIHDQGNFSHGHQAMLQSNQQNKPNVQSYMTRKNHPGKDNTLQNNYTSMMNPSANAMGSVGQVAVAGTHGIVGNATGVSNSNRSYHQQQQNSHHNNQQSNGYRRNGPSLQGPGHIDKQTFYNNSNGRQQPSFSVPRASNGLQNFNQNGDLSIHSHRDNSVNVTKRNFFNQY